MEEIKKLTIKDKLYPPKLLDIKNHPKVIYYAGDIRLLDKNILAIVGSRACSEYGRRIANQFAKEISKKNICIISGLALGIDIAAHLGAMKEQGKTIAVLGGGIKNVYPPENREFLSQILKNGGLVISEYPENAEANNANFPKRNRIISAISDGVLVVEAEKRSGSNITARLAKEQHKKLYCIPSNIDSINGVGTNLLIQKGAKMVINKNDILEDFHLENLNNQPIKISEIEDEYQEIYQLFNKGPIHINRISKTLKMPVGELSKKLLILELKGMLQKVNSNEYIKVGENYE